MDKIKFGLEAGRILWFALMVFCFIAAAWSESVVYAVLTIPSVLMLNLMLQINYVPPPRREREEVEEYVQRTSRDYP
jgi:hypothetical protein